MAKLWGFGDLESLDPAWPPVESKSFSAFIGQNMEPRGGDAVWSYWGDLKGFNVRWMPSCLVFLLLLWPLVMLLGLWALVCSPGKMEQSGVVGQAFWNFSRE